MSTKININFQNVHLNLKTEKTEILFYNRQTVIFNILIIFLNKTNRIFVHCENFVLTLTQLTARKNVRRTSPGEDAAGLSVADTDR